MESIGASDTRTRFSELPERVARVESFRITQKGLSVACLVPDGPPDPECVARAAERLKRFHEEMPEVPLQEILDARHEGHRPQPPPEARPRD